MQPYSAARRRAHSAARGLAVAALGAALVLFPAAVLPAHAEFSDSGVWTPNAGEDTVNAAPTNSVPPTFKVGDQPVAGGRMRALPGTWDDYQDLQVSWFLNGKVQALQINPEDGTTWSTDPWSAVAGVDGGYFRIPFSAVGQRLTAKVTAVNHWSKPTIVTLDAGVVKAASFIKAPAPTLTGVKAVGGKLTAKAGTWSPSATLSYQWKRNGAAIAGATKPSYTVVSRDFRTSITVTVTASKLGYAKTSKTSAAAAIKTKLFKVTAKPRVSGTPKAGATLTVVKPVTTPAASSFAYRWYSGTTAIKGATAAKYKVKVADRGRKLSVRVTLKRTDYTSVTVASAAVSVRR